MDSTARKSLLTMPSSASSSEKTIHYDGILTLKAHAPDRERITQVLMALNHFVQGGTSIGPQWIVSGWRLEEGEEMYTALQTRTAQVFTGRSVSQLLTRVKDRYGT